MLKRSGMFQCSQNLKWKLGNEYRELTIKRPGGIASFLFSCFPSLFLLLIPHGIKKTVRNYVCMLAP